MLYSRKTSQRAENRKRSSRKRPRWSARSVLRGKGRNRENMRREVSLFKTRSVVISLWSGNDARRCSLQPEEESALAFWRGVSSAAGASGQWQGCGVSILGGVYRELQGMDASVWGACPLKLSAPRRLHENATAHRVQL